MTITVRESSDLKLIYAMERICFPHDTPYKLHGSKWWIASIDGQTVGFCGAKALLGPSAVYLCRAGVMPGHRGAGIQRRMIRARVAWARKCQGIDMVITDTSKDNIGSSNNLIRCGFSLYTPQSKWGFDDGLYWRLKIPCRLF